MALNGGKHYLASKIVALFPPHIHYAEPYFGGGSVLLASNPEGRSEVVNDIDGNLMLFWRVMRDREMFSEFQRMCEATPFSEEKWRESKQVVQSDDCPSDVVRAYTFFVFCRQSLAGRMKSFSPLSKTRVCRGMNEQASVWITCVEGLPPVHARLIRVAMRSTTALEVIKQEDGCKTLYYCDPPYLPITRAAPAVYEHEMSFRDHAEMLEVLKEVEGKVILSGYANDLYNAEISDWNRHDFDLPNNSAGGATKRRMTECVWCNF